ncbi:dihydroorotase [Balneicella halophila]|uniref:Dihydroorotase n=1 Tax=Balneicella halophila TaxID=1537566 RepID=A0A7L4USA6_BALHA|nr:dihydroorotase [Balneicella halophila]PVX52653.1 dihydroorotase [Balneicella halophila]
MKNTLIKDATIINEGREFKGSILIENEKISEIIEGNVSDSYGQNYNIIDASGSYLIPGVIDDQVHFREPGLTQKGDLYTESKAAAAGGVTSFMDMPNLIPQTTTLPLLEDKHALAQTKAMVNYGFYIGGTNENWKEITAADLNLACGIKIFMGSSTGNMLVDNREVLNNFFANAKILIATHCEDEETIRTNIKNALEKYGEDFPIAMHPQIRSREACYKSSSLAVKLAKQHDARLHILHLSTADELQLLEKGNINNKQITAEACVHHLWFSDEDYKRLGRFIKWNPAIKTSKDRDALIQALNENVLDVIATDHAPHTLKEKSGVYTKAASGGPLVQHALQAVLELHEQGKFAKEQVVHKMCHAPAQLFGIKNRGYIRKGYQADLCIFKKEKHTVNKDNLLYKCGWSPFDGTTFSHTITHTFANGHLIYNNGKFDESIKGQALIYNR